MENNGTLRLVILELKHELLKIAENENLQLAVIIVDVEGSVVFNYTMEGVSELASKQCLTKAKMLAMSIKEKGVVSTPSFGMAEGAVPIVYNEQYVGVMCIAGTKNNVRIAKLALENINTF